MEKFNSIILSENVKVHWEDMVDEFMQSNGHTKNADGLYEFVNRDDFEFWSESGYVKIDKLTVGDIVKTYLLTSDKITSENFAKEIDIIVKADLAKVNKSMPDITSKGMRHIENELRYYYYNLKVMF